MAQKFLDRPQIAAAREKMGGETVAQGMGGGRFRQHQENP